MRAGQLSPTDQRSRQKRDSFLRDGQSRDPRYYLEEIKKKIQIALMEEERQSVSNKIVVEGEDHEVQVVQTQMPTEGIYDEDDIETKKKLRKYEKHVQM
jgi:hypothetical protein